MPSRSWWPPPPPPPPPASGPVLFPWALNLFHTGAQPDLVPPGRSLADADEGAVFDTPFAMTWSLGDEREDVLNGRTGMTLDDEETPSSTCQAAFFAAHARLAGGAAEDVEFTPRAYADAKREADEEYDDAKNDLFAHPKMFEPRRDFPGWHEKKSLRASGYERRRALAIRLGAADRASV